MDIKPISLVSPWTITGALGPFAQLLPFPTRSLRQPSQHQGDTSPSFWRLGPLLSPDKNSGDPSCLLIPLLSVQQTPPLGCIFRDIPFLHSFPLVPTYPFPLWRMDILIKMGASIYFYPSISVTLAHQQFPSSSQPHILILLFLYYYLK